MPLMAYLMLRGAACPEEPPQAASRRGRVSKHAGRQCSTPLSFAASSFTCALRERGPTPGSQSEGRPVRVVRFVIFIPGGGSASTTLGVSPVLRPLGARVSARVGWRTAMRQGCRAQRGG